MDHKQLRMRGLSAVKRNWGLAIGAAVMAWLLAGMGARFIPKLDFSWTEELSRSYTHNFTQNSRVTFTFSPATAFSLAHFIIGGTIQLGYCKFLLKQHDNANPEFNDVFSEFDRFGDGFAQNFLVNLYVALWSLLFIIPGIIKGISYAMTPYIMAENPGMRASEAITRSQEMMDGYKADYFILELTFIGWDILAMLTLNIGYLWLNPYKNAAKAAFYRDLQNRQRNT